MISPAPINSTAVGGGSTDSIPLNQKIQASAAANPTETQTHPPNRPTQTRFDLRFRDPPPRSKATTADPSRLLLLLLRLSLLMISQAGSLLMDKKRQRQLGVALHKNNTFAGGLIESSNSDNDPDLQDSWVIVKKQRVRIVIPPLLVATKSPLPNPGPVQLRPVAREAEGNESQFPVETETCAKTTSVHEQKKIKSLAPKRVVQVTRKSPPAKYISTFPKPMKQDLRMELRNPDQIATSESHRTLGVSKTSKAIIQPKRLRHGPSIFIDQGMLLNQKLRALNLKRKLQRAGGLSRWLASLGLGQFVRIFKRKGLGKFQLVNLTMKKLKDMGANAVGPRRKLMHAIDCFCQPCLY